MSTILLVRHGVPLVDQRTRILGREFEAWVRAYDAAPIDRSITPSREACDLVASAAYIATSTLRRSIESAGMLAPDRRSTSEVLFVEAGIPTTIPFGLRLNPSTWDALARGAWVAGYSRGTESFRNSVARAARAADRLVDLVAQHQHVALIGHGMLNTLIARDLRARGWRGSGSPRQYWGHVELSLC